MGLNSWGEELWLLYSKLLVRGMHGVTDRASLNWLFGVSCTVLVLSSGIGGALTESLVSDQFFGVNLPGPKYVSQGAGMGSGSSYK